MKRAIVPGTFDPITEGHLDIIRRTAQLFDSVLVAVAASPTKGASGPLFSLEERVELVRSSIAEFSNVEVKPFDGLLVKFAQDEDATVVVKGLRVVTDFEYEFQMAAMNYTLDTTLETMFIMSSPKYMYLSSSIVRELARLGGPYRNFVPECVYEALKKKYE